ncbi:hypothetical protein [Geothrix sp. PMB-07]|uniref:hypothetical protein n=1 Tax=Geothrix sp. PMB-07 TaxID=3068640 RepID=UPI00274115C2|nr:hypothetical protein [Geothrix sp. PMB-07]WLT31125.1 hypothetical protein Q9293_15520 [Geothrix sp. PMB-07]
MDEAREFHASMGLQRVFFFAEEGRLFWHAPSQLRPEDLARALIFKAELIHLVEDEALEALCAAVDPEEAADIREERAAVLEFEGGLSRMEAELRAGLITRTQTEAA